ncbi:DUF3119 family protein [Synechococcus elongatus]|uniref:DUF3119 family protein n=1 Tax=Synechococcus elongatus PCC 11801 TaxID=2219813 RepID=A0AAN1QLH7_SYNEL|nr:DUF3119 family protein [Synechococcus elongatus]AZB71557.1 DUF3119 domain-containing protein [Synechococcus elongatus PCC 11801]
MLTDVATAPTVLPLAPSYRLPGAVVLAALPLLWLNLWLSLGVAAFGLFLVYQAATLRLFFTATDLDIYRGDRLLRRFPYSMWLNWRIYWSPLPVLFYFRETESIHFLPILFDSRGLRAALEQFCPAR